MYSKIIDKYLSEHKSNYKPKYVYHSCDRIGQRTFKFHYYVRDRQLLQMNIFMTIHIGDEIEITIKEDIYDYEQWAIACDALERIRAYTNRKTTILVEDIPQIVETRSVKASYCPQDMIYILNYIMYHHQKNPDSVHMFYEIFIPYLHNRLKEQRYKEFILSIKYLFEAILSEMIWLSFNVKYLDQEYMMHSAYISSILNMVDNHFKVLYKQEKELLLDIFKQLFSYWRFAFSQYASIEKITIHYPKLMMDLLSSMDRVYNYSSLDGGSLVYDIVYALATNDEVSHRHSIIELLKLLLTDILSFANPEDQKNTGLHFLMMAGFDLLLEIFDQTKDAYVYQCFGISEIPVDFHPFIKKQLETALQYWANEMKLKGKQVDIIDQIMTINTLLIENFKIQ